MKKIIYIAFAIAALFAGLFYSQSCKKLLSKEIEVKNELEFEVTGTRSVVTKAGEEDAVVLYEGDLDINLNAEIEKVGISKNIVKALSLKKGQIVAVSSGFNLTLLNKVKLYFGDKNNLVASSNGVKDGVLTFTIHKPELLQKLNGEKLHIIITGSQPLNNVQLKLITDYVATLSLL